jgi:S1-C subfamily serine protease
MTTPPHELSELLVSVAERAEQALVHVSAHCRGGASGSLFASDGLVLTTARAIGGRERLQVTRGDEQVDARVLGFDVATDLALLKTETPLGEAPSFGAAPARLGTLVVSGSRPGRAARVRLGLVSQVGGQWHTPRGGRIERYVETDLAPEPGFSGGLVFDVHGRALGMSSAGLLRGVPLLLEHTTLSRIASSLAQHGRVRRGYLGVGTQAVRLPDALAQRRGQSWGLLVASVQSESAAERAGVLLGDVLLTLGDQALVHSGALMAALEAAEDTPASLALWRGGQELSLAVTPGARP